jgi:hypothetical protein
VDQGRAERDQRLHLKRPVVDVVGLGYCLAQQADRRVCSSCVKRTQTGLQASSRRSLGGRSVGERALLLRRVGGIEYADARVGPELASEERNARISLNFSRG